MLAAHNTTSKGKDFSHACMTDLRYTKPNFIHTMLEKCKVPVVYMDCDLVVMAEPLHIAEALRSVVSIMMECFLHWENFGLRQATRRDNVDWGTTNLLADEVSSCWLPVERFFGDSATSQLDRLRYFVPTGRVQYLSTDQVQSNAAISFFSNTAGARQVLRCWHQAITFHCSAVCQPSSDAHPERSKGFLTFADDHILDWVWNNRRKIYGGVLEHVRPYWLPDHYARLPISIFAAPIVNHPDFGSTGPRLRLAAHKGNRRFNFDISTQRKSTLAKIDRGIPIKTPDTVTPPADSFLAVDIQDRSVGYFLVGTGYTGASELAVEGWPPAMLEWGRWRNPWS